MNYKTLDEIKVDLEELVKVINSPQAYLPTYNWSEGSGRPHIEVHNDGYHFVVSERGNEIQRKVTQDLDDILYWSISGATFSMASQYELKHRIPDQDFRRLLFKKDLELLGKVNSEFAQRRRSELEKNLEKHPYSDLIELQLQETTGGSIESPLELKNESIDTDEFAFRYVGFWQRVGIHLLDLVILSPLILLYRYAVILSFEHKTIFPLIVYYIFTYGLYIFFTVKFGGTPARNLSFYLGGNKEIFNQFPSNSNIPNTNESSSWTDKHSKYHKESCSFC